jgi:adenine/guanine phosphoribosyltransferase-like PRPP-binding protein
MPLRFRGTADLHRTVVEGIPNLPSDLDLVVGVARSGLLPAWIISSYLDLPMTDVDGLVEGQLIRHATSTRDDVDEAGVVDEAVHVLVIDDSIGHGSQMRQVRERLAGMTTGRTVSFAAVYATPSGAESADVVFEQVPWGRAFSWNLMHHDLLDACCVDADGVLWDPASPPSTTSDPDPIWQPTTPIGWIVTAHEAEHADAVRAWLTAHSIRSRGLIMPNRGRSGEAGTAFKARVYRRTAARLLITDEPDVARRLMKRSGASTLSLREQRLFTPPLHRRALTRLTRQVARRRR